MNKKRKIIGPFTKLEGKDVFLFPLIAVLMAVMSMIYPLVVNNGFFHIADDFDTQMLPFLYNLRHAFKYGVNSYSWDTDLGTPMFYAYSYYGLGTPFFYLTCLFPESFVPHIMGWILALKYVVASYTSLIFLKRFTSKDQYAMLGAYLYAFSGYQSVNLIFYFFHDVVAFFPLMLLGIEDMIRAFEEADKDKLKKSGLFFAVAVCLNCVTNYFFFVQSVLILVVYFIARVNTKTTFKKILLPFGYGCLGVLMSAFMFIPNMIYILSNKRSHINWESIFAFYKPDMLLFIVKGFLFPPEAMIDNTAFLEHKCTSTSSYLPFIGLLFVISYIITKKDWLSRFIKVMLVISFFPLGNGFFFLFTLVNHRWWYLLIMMMSLASVLVLQEPEKFKIKKAMIIDVALLAVFATLSYFSKDENGASLILHSDRFIYELVFVLITTTLAFAFVTFGKRRVATGLITTGAVLSAIITTIYTEYHYVNSSPVPTDHYVNTIKAGMEMPGIEDRYRYRNYAAPLISFAQERGTNGLSTYTSTGDNMLTEFDALFEFYQKDNRLNKNNVPGLPEFLGGRYIYTAGLETEENFKGDAIGRGIEVDSYDIDGKEWRLLEYLACPIGFSVDKVMPRSEFDKLEWDKKGIALLNAIVVSDDELENYAEDMEVSSVAEVNDLINRYPDYAEGDALYANPCIAELVSKNYWNATTSFTKDEHGFYGESDYDDDRYVMITVPADDGWQFTIDGSQAEIINNNGLVLIKLPAGHHEFAATYKLPGWRLSLLASAIGALIFAYLCFALYTSVHNR